MVIFFIASAVLLLLFAPAGENTWRAIALVSLLAIIYAIVKDDK